jgi:cell division protease FtsH
MIGQISSGAMNDLEKVTRQAYAMVAYLGMSDKIGNVSFYDSTENAGFNIGKPYSETTAQLIDKEVKRIIDQAYDMARKVLKENKEGFLKLATILLEKEVIFADDLETIFGKRQTPDSQPDTKNKEKEEVENTD